MEKLFISLSAALIAIMFAPTPIYQDMIWGPFSKTACTGEPLVCYEVRLGAIYMPGMLVIDTNAGAFWRKAP